MSSMLDRKDGFELVNGRLNNTSRIKPTLTDRIEKLTFHIFLETRNELNTLIKQPLS